MYGNGNNQQLPERFEDQLRQMIISGGGTPTTTAENQTPQRPVVRLPPQQSTHSAQISTSSYRRVNDTQPQRYQESSQRQYYGSQAGTIRTNHTAPQAYAANNNSRAPSGNPSNSTQRNQPRQYDRQAYQPNMARSYNTGPNAYTRTQPQGYSAPNQGVRQLYNPNGPGSSPYTQNPYRLLKAQYMQSIADHEVPLVEMNQAERDEKETFRARLQSICHDVCASDPERFPKVNIECFGSFQSGFASAGSDMDLVIVLHDAGPSAACFSLLEADLPRRLEKCLLQRGHGARLLTRTRVPIIKVCEKPDVCLLSQLREEREKWDDLSDDAKYPHLKKEDDEPDESDVRTEVADATHAIASTPMKTPAETQKVQSEASRTASGEPKDGTGEQLDRAETPTAKPTSLSTPGNHRQQNQTWTRERKGGPLDFPRTGVGIQSDINFFNPLGLHNTHMLRCYSMCDPRVRPIVLFIKAWAKKRKINSSYSGTLSSYGYVLMVLHYLVNIARPPVLPNLQMSWRPSPQCTAAGADRVQVDNWVVDFWRREAEIASAASSGQLTTNRESVGSLLSGFFHYYASQSGGPSFHWMQQILSLRSEGGLLTKEQKGWVKAVTEEGEGKKVQHRYLFCIEDPFELNHNVARTVTHHGIVAIRDEFRRANRILNAIGNNTAPSDGHIFDEITEDQLEDQAGQHGQTKNNANIASKRQQQYPMKQQNHPDMKDDSAFPALGMPVSKPRANPTNRKKEATQHYAEISGEQAKMLLEDMARKKAEQQAADTATGAAEAALRE